MIIDKVSVDGLIGFNDEFHKYFFIEESKRNLQFKSATQIAKGFQPEFPLEERSLKTAQDMGITQQQVKDKWKQAGIEASIDGTYIHSILEHLALNGMPVTLTRWHPKLTGAFQFYEDYIISTKYNKPVYKVVNCEQILYYLDDTRDAYFAGQRDIMLEEISTGRLLSIDYKSSKSIKYESYYNNGSKEYLKGSFSFLENCNYNTFTIQLNLYKLFDTTYNDYARKKAEQGLYDMYICHITETGYSMIKVDDLDIEYSKETGEFISNKQKLKVAANLSRFLLD